MVKETIIPKSYKQTDVGVIPDDWQVKRLSEIAKISRGASPRPIEDPRWFDDKSEVGWVRISDVTKSDKYLLNTEQKLSLEGIKKSRPVNKDNLIMSICATVGRPIITKIDVCIHDGFVVFDKLQENKEYTYYYLSSIENKWSKHGQTGSQMNLNTTLINNEIMILPKSLVEQTAIASALRDTDELIRRLEDLITKKRNIKQGAMQQLLIGKKRLPGFSGKWETKKLGEMVIKITTGLNPRQNFNLGEGNNYYVTIKNFKNGKLYLDDKCDKVSNEALALINKRSNLETGDILFASIGIEPSTYLIRKVPLNWNINESVFSIKPNKSIIDSRFLQYLLIADWIFEYLAKDATGSTFQSIKVKQLKNLELIYPSLKEQGEIATILSDIDAEIDELEQKLDKYKMIKQGMMQELLTGRTRLI